MGTQEITAKSVKNIRDPYRFEDENEIWLEGFSRFLKK